MVRQSGNSEPRIISPTQLRRIGSSAKGMLIMFMAHFAVVNLRIWGYITIFGAISLAALCGATVALGGFNIFSLTKIGPTYNNNKSASLALIA